MNESLHIAWVTRFEALEAELNRLDAATGDGDHGTTMLKGLKAVAASNESPAKAFRKAAGGASGTLFSVLIGALDKSSTDLDSLPSALHKASQKISELGQAIAGDKTMLDALVPAARAVSLIAAVSAAHDGYRQTESMSAKRGRARHVEGAGVGHRDAGARSVVELLAVLSEAGQPDRTATRHNTQH